MVTRVSVSSDIPTLANFPPHLHSGEQRQESMTVDMDSDIDSDNSMVMYSHLHTFIFNAIQEMYQTLKNYRKKIYFKIYFMALAEIHPFHVSCSFCSLKKKKSF